MICTATISGVLIEASGDPEDCEDFICELLCDLPHITETQKNEREAMFNGSWWTETGLSDRPTMKTCDPFKRHYGSCGAADCPIMTTSKPKCGRCNDTHELSSNDSVNWIAGRHFAAKFIKTCPECVKNAVL